MFKYLWSMLFDRNSLTCWSPFQMPIATSSTFKLKKVPLNVKNAAEFKIATQMCHWTSINASERVTRCSQKCLYHCSNVRKIVIKSRFDQILKCTKITIIICAKLMKNGHSTCRFTISLFHKYFDQFKFDQNSRILIDINVPLSNATIRPNRH